MCALAVLSGLGCSSRGGGVRFRVEERVIYGRDLEADLRKIEGRHDERVAAFHANDPSDADEAAILLGLQPGLFAWIAESNRAERLSEASAAARDAELARATTGIEPISVMECVLAVGDEAEASWTFSNGRRDWRLRLDAVDASVATIRVTKRQYTARSGNDAITTEERWPLGAPRLLGQHSTHIPESVQVLEIGKVEPMPTRRSQCRIETGAGSWRQ